MEDKVSFPGPTLIPDIPNLVLLPNNQCLTRRSPQQGMKHCQRSLSVHRHHEIELSREKSNSTLSTCFLQRLCRTRQDQGSLSCSSSLRRRDKETAFYPFQKAN